MFLSILIPAYNCEKYIDGCIKSIIQQDFQDYELIIINDGSTDKTNEKCVLWANKYPEKIRYVSKQNTGAYLTRRALLREAKGEYLCFIDADDNYIRNDALSMIKRTIIESQCDMVFFDATSDLSTMKKKFNYPYKNGEVFEGDRISEIYRLFVNTKKFQHLWNKVFSRTLVDFEQPDNSFGYRMLRDGVYQIVPLISRANRIVYLDKVLYYYRTDNEESVSHSFSIDFYFSMVDLHKRILECSKQWKYKNVNTDEYVKAGCTTDMCIAAIKSRNLPNDANMTRFEYIKMISKEQLFRQQYTQKYLDMFRKPVAWALFHKQYWLISVAASLVDAAKKMRRVVRK